MLALVFAVWCVVVITGAAVHEPWWDEAQGWLIARDASLPELFTHVVRYEGHPPLWYLILAVPAKLGLPYWTMKIPALVAGAATTLLLLYGFPRVPLYIRALAPFAFFIAYQYTVVARSYVLIAPLLLGIARLWDRRPTALLILLSHVSVHGFAIACALFVLTFKPRRSAILFILNAALLIAMLWPPADNPSYTAHHSPFSPQRYATLITSVIPATFWGPLGDESRATVIAIICAAIAAVLILIAWFFRNGVGLLFLGATAAVFFVFARYYSIWHEGILFALFLFATVLAFGKGTAPRWLDVAAQIVLVILLVQHARWTFQSLAYDTREEFTGSERAAEFIRAEQLDGRVMYGAGLSVVELQPYFEKNLFANYRAGHAYWEWSRKNDWPYSQQTPASRAKMEQWFRRNVAEGPDIIVCGYGFGDDYLYAVSLARYSRYRTIGVFPGTGFWKTRPWRTTAFHIFERVR